MAAIAEARLGSALVHDDSRRGQCVKRRTEPAAISVYLGDHWLIYSGSSGDFDYSEQVSPGLVLGSQTAPVEVTDDRARCITAECLLHAAGQWSSAVCAGVVVVYLDPLGPCGNAIQHCVAGGIQAWDPGADLTWVTAAPGALWLGAASPSSVRGWVQSLSQRLAADLPRPSPVVQRLRRATDVLAREEIGRLHVASLAADVGWSAEHLRKEFRRVAGVTMSRYQLWRRMLRMVASACEQHGRGERVDAEAMILDAGFYDVPHGGRAIRRHFGITSSDAAAPRVHFIDCR